MYDDGFSYTGFYHYGRIITNPSLASDYNFKNTTKRIKKHCERFQTCKSVDLNTVDQIKLFIKECHDRNIKVVAFLPPFSHHVLQMMQGDGNYQYLHMIYNHLKPFFQIEGFYLYDYTDVTKIGGEDRNFIDGFHAGVPVTNLIFKDILTQNSSLSSYFTSSENIDSINKEYINNYPSFHNIK